MKSTIENGVLLEVHPDDIINGHFDGGTEITHVAKEAFINRIDLISVALPDVEEMRDRGFFGCNKLIVATLSKTLVIDEKAFAKCKNLRYLIINNRGLLTFGVARQKSS